MEDIGIIKLGHQKKLLLAIKRIKDILSGKWIAPGITNNAHVSKKCLSYKFPWYTIFSLSTSLVNYIQFIVPLIFFGCFARKHTVF